MDLRETFDADVVMNELAEVAGVSLSPPLLESTYNGRRVILYAIRYSPPLTEPKLDIPDS